MRYFRFSIDRLMVLVAIAAGMLWVYRLVNGFAFVVLIIYSTLLIGQVVLYVARFRRLSPRKSWWIFAASTLVSSLLFGALGVTFVGMFQLMIKILLAFVIVPIPLGLGIAWILGLRGQEAGRRPRQYLAWAVVLGLVAIPLSMVFDDWPMRLAFRASLPALDRLADRVEAGDPPQWPVRAGLFWVSGIARGHRNSANIALSIDTDPDGNNWLVRSANPEVPLPIPGQVFVSKKLTNDGRWWLQEED